MSKDDMILKRLLKPVIDSELKDAIIKCEPILDKSLDKIKSVTNDIRSLEELLNLKGVHFDFEYIFNEDFVRDQAIDSNGIRWTNQVDKSNGFRIYSVIFVKEHRHEVPDKLYKPLDETKITVRLKAAKHLPDFLLRLTKELT